MNVSKSSENIKRPPNGWSGPSTSGKPVAGTGLFVVVGAFGSLVVELVLAVDALVVVVVGAFVVVVVVPVDGHGG